jgi:phenylalanyl-tRNA synthetase beta chain
VVPGHRRDLHIEADISEEIARVRGYETLAAHLPVTESPPYRPDPRRRVDELRDLLAGAGLVELITHGLIGPEDHARLGYGAGEPGTIRAANPVTIDHSELRRSLIPAHLRVVVENERQRDPDIHAFEIGALHHWRDGQPVERQVLGLILSGRDRPVAFDRPSKVMDVADAKGLLEQAASRLASCRLVYALRPGWRRAPGRTAAVRPPRDGGTPSTRGRAAPTTPGGVRCARRPWFAEVELDPGCLARSRAWAG